MTWYLVVLLCAALSVTYPNSKHGLCALIFTLSAVAPELLGISGMTYFLVCSAVAVFSLIIINSLDGISPYSIRLQYLLLFDVALNMVGVILWYNYVSIHVSNAIFEITGYSLAGEKGEFFLYEFLAIVFYLVAAWFIYDRKGRASGACIIDIITNYANGSRTKSGA